jgi:hypothetical protein
MRANPKSWPIALLLCGTAGTGFAVGVRDTSVSAVDLIQGTETVIRRISMSCNIKGNISIEGERIYHLPGQRDYDVTGVIGIYGERYFCSEAEARQAGWRRAEA